MEKTFTHRQVARIGILLYLLPYKWCKFIKATSFVEIPVQDTSVDQDSIPEAKVSYHEDHANIPNCAASILQKKQGPAPAGEWSDVSANNPAETGNLQFWDPGLQQKQKNSHIGYLYATKETEGK